MNENDLSCVAPCSLHVDGAQFYRDDEYLVYSWSSSFSVFGNIHDCLMQKYPIAVIPEREMLDESVT